MIDVQIVKTVKYGHQTIEKLHATYIMNKDFILIDLFLQNVSEKYRESIKDKLSKVIVLE